ncbi:hypothetical protein GN244_ATG00489 [Phytophthora infestans]|uniref:Uncharacterized protein n=1 Tax=Phytophthora infestans TaxID=4787 RepID=A0A833THE6_PHYIN|nr:hypothetical protein GN244_ATG00489 [Phytophthora infestans]
MRLAGKNAVLKGALPLILRPRSVLESMWNVIDMGCVISLRLPQLWRRRAYSAQYAARVSVQNPRRSIEKMSKC